MVVKRENMGKDKIRQMRKRMRSLHLPLNLDLKKVASGSFCGKCQVSAFRLRENSGEGFFQVSEEGGCDFVAFGDAPVFAVVVQVDGYRGGDGLSAGGDTVCQESDGVGLTAFGSVFQSLGGCQVGGVLFLIGVYNRRKSCQLVRFRSTEASIPSSDRSSDVME